MKIRHFIFSLTLFAVEAVVASPKSLTYQGRIVKSDGKPLEYSSVSFQFEITDTAGTCVIYREQVNGLNMQNSNGIFDVKIGASNSYPGAPSFSILTSFRNSGTFTCDGGIVYTPSANDDRRLRVQFFDGTAWRLISPDSIIRSVPFAAFANDANNLGARPAADYVLKSEINGNVTCNAGSFLTWNATTKSFGCAAGGSGSGGVSSVTNGDTYLSIADTTTTPSISVNVGQVAGTLAAGNDSRFTNARTPTGTASGDLTGSYPNPSIATIQGATVTFTGATNGQFLKYDGASWVPATLPAGNAGTVTSITAGTGLTGGAITTSGTIGLGTELAAVNSLATNGVVVRSGAGSYTTTSASPIASANTLVQRDANGISGFNGIDVNGTTSGILSLLVPTITTSYSLTFPSAQGGLNQVLMNDGTGLLAWANMPTAPAGNCGANEVLTYSSGAFSCVPDQTGSAGTGITTFNGQTGSTQSLGIVGTAGTAPAWSSNSSVHTLNIPMANTASVTAGLISKSEYDAFTNKLGKSSNLSDLANTTTARTNLGLGTAAVKNAPASGDAAAAEVVLGNDTRLVAVSGKVDKTQIAQCTTAQTLSYVSVSDNWSCQSIAIADSQLSFTSKSANTFLAAPSGGSGTPTFRTIASADLPTSLTNGLWTESGGNVSRSGSVGIGTASPSTTLDVVGPVTSSSGYFNAYRYDDTAANGAGYHGNRYRGTLGAANPVLLNDTLTGLYGAGGVNSTTMSALVGAIRIVAAENFSPTANGTKLEFATTALGGTSRNTNMVLSPAGYLGIGTTNPSGKIHVKTTYGDLFSSDYSTLGTRLNINAAATAFDTRAILTFRHADAERASIYTQDVGASGGGPYPFILRTFGSTDDIQLRPNNILGLTVQASTGNVGIGTNSPERKLTVVNDGSGAALALRTYDNSVAGNGSHFLGERARGSASSPTEPLSGDMLATFQGRSAISPNSYPGMRINADENFTATAQGSSIRFHTVDIGTVSSLERVRISPPGNVGIGVTGDPTARLDVQNAGHGLPATTGSTDAAVALRVGAVPVGTNVTIDMGVKGGTGDAWIQARNRTTFATNYNLMLNPNGGSVGIGSTTSPAYALDIAPGADKFIRIQDSDTTTGEILIGEGTSGAANFAPVFWGKSVGAARSTGLFGQVTSADDTGTVPAVVLTARVDGSSAMTTRPVLGVNNNSTRVMTINAGGDMGVGIATPSAKLHVVEAAAGVAAKFANSAGTCSLTPSSSAATWACTSDIRLKKDIEPISGEDALNAMLKLDAVTYALKKGDDGRRHTGYIAQNVQKVAPEFVIQDEDGTLQVSYTGFIPWITEGLKTLHLKVLELVQQDQKQSRAIASLKEENEMMRAYLCAKDPAAPFCKKSPQKNVSK